MLARDILEPQYEELFALRSVMRFSQAHAWAAAILVDKFGTGHLQRAANRQIVIRCRSA
jgi:hypothetical protein